MFTANFRLAIKIANGRSENETWITSVPSDLALENSSDSSDNSSNLDLTMELVEVETSDFLQIFLSIKSAITNLFRTSMVIRNVPIEDDYARSATRYHLPTEWDVRHVGDLFASAKKEKPWLVQRLGRAMTRRRQFLRYRAQHHEQLSAENIQEAGAAEGSRNSLWTKAATYAADPSQSLLDIINEAEKEVESNGSRTSYEPTVNEEASGILNVPPLPYGPDGMRVDYGEPFQSIVVRCETQEDKVYEDGCPLLCSDWASSLRKVHNEQVRANLKLPDTVPYGSVKQLRRHVGRHLEQLALSVLPGFTDEAESDSGKQDRRDSDELSHATREDSVRNPNEYFLIADGISRAVLQMDMCKYLGPEATARPGTYHVRHS
ncbi:hypothetical protein MMC18_001757 [Xylographa bjoerkii]|nr:hypothetical protein [Xylographa bjoerkii]